VAKKKLFLPLIQLTHDPWCNMSKSQSKSCHTCCICKPLGYYSNSSGVEQYIFTTVFHNVQSLLDDVFPFLCPTWAREGFWGQTQTGRDEEIKCATAYLLRGCHMVRNFKTSSNHTHNNSRGAISIDGFLVQTNKFW
jgi:hypothetical protein